MFGKRFKAGAADYGVKTLKAVSVQYAIFSSLVAQVAVVWLSTKGSFFPGADTFQQIVGTLAEVIAGLYGITLAGYTFFLSRMDALTATDMTIDYVVASIKLRFKLLIWYITLTVAATLAISVVLMYYPVESGLLPEFVYRLICNEFVLFIGFSVGLILYYSLSVIDPNCLAKEAAKLKKKLCARAMPEGSATEFICLYDRIEGLCNGMIPDNVLNQIHDNKGKRFEYTIALLHERYPQLRPILPDLNRVHRYYECMVNCSPLTASQEMCILAKRLCTVLEEANGKKRIVPKE